MRRSRLIFVMMTWINKPGYVYVYNYTNNSIMSLILFAVSKSLMFRRSRGLTSRTPPIHIFQHYTSPQSSRPDRPISICLWLLLYWNEHWWRRNSREIRKSHRNSEWCWPIWRNSLVPWGERQCQCLCYFLLVLVLTLMLRLWKKSSKPISGMLLKLWIVWLVTSAAFGAKCKQPDSEQRSKFFLNSTKRHSSTSFCLALA